MNTETGRTYRTDENGNLVEVNGVLTEQFVSPELLREEFESEKARGEIVAVSEEVVNLLNEGRASRDRKAKRKAAQASRKANRGK